MNLNEFNMIEKGFSKITKAIEYNRQLKKELSNLLELTGKLKISPETLKIRDKLKELIMRM